jgi:predicted dehydrogenase
VNLNVSRRAFLRGAGLVLAAPYVLTTDALGADTGTAASDRIVTGHIGVGGMGGGHLGGCCHRAETRVAAVCDVDENHLKHAVEVTKGQATGGQAIGTRDHRELLDRKDIDAVIVASPDHWHALHTIHACEAGKDVYSEKPMMNTVAEGQGMVRAARRFGRVVQIGTQGRSTRAGRYAAQFIRNGHCGRIHTVKTWHPPNPVAGWETPQPPPKELDWDRWVGPNAMVPYSPRRCHFSFRYFLDFGGGNIRDRGAHIFSIVSWAMGVDATGPVSVECPVGVVPPGDMYDTATDMHVVWEFKNPDWTFHWIQPGENYGNFGFGMKFFGEKSDLVVNGGDSSISHNPDPRIFVEPASHETLLYKSDDHMGNFLQCIRTREKPIMDVGIAHRVTSVCILGNIAFRLGRKLNWDTAKEQFIGDEEANRYLNPPMRAPWHL